MDTNKSSTRETRIRSALVPRAEPGAAKMILRRDLLTGAALVVVGSAGGCAKAPPPPAAAASPPLASSAAPGNLLRTKFMADFTAKFIGDPTKMPAPGDSSTWPDPNRIWPDPKTNPQRDVVATQYATFVNLLTKFGYVGGPPPAKPSDPLGADIWQFLSDQNWPNQPPPPGYDQTKVPLVEIAVILDRLLQALNTYQVAGSSTSSGGGPSSWPPH